MLGETIKAERERQGLSQRSLAQRASVSRKHLSDLENGANVSVEVLERIARALNMIQLPLSPKVTLRLADGQPEPIEAATIRAAAVRIASEADRILRRLGSRARDERTWPPPGLTRRRLPAIDLLREPPPDAPYEYVQNLEDEEWVEVPIRGYVAAGAPLELLTFDDGESASVPRKDSPPAGLEVLRARGDSMVDFGIDDGDLVYVEPRRGGVAAHGEIVIMWLNDGLVIKRWHHRRKKQMLISGNDEYPPIELTPDDVWELQAIVRAVVKRDVRRIEFKPVSG